MKIPKPYNEDRDPDPFWKEGPNAYHDQFDKFIEKGFISDVVYYFRGTEVPTIYAIWGALTAVSSVIKREAWLQWYPGEFYSNLYVILIGPAGGKKTTMVDFVIDMLHNYHLRIESAEWQRIKTLNVLKNKASPEGILEMMKPGGSIDIEDGEEIHIYDGTSEMFIGLTEMSAMINNQKYNESVISNFLDLYDCHGTWEWTTKGSGKVILKNLFTTLLAATTPAAFKESMPKESIGDGFLSRTIIANAGSSNPRRFWQPIPTKGGPDKLVLYDRLAYIAQATQGTYVLSKEANEYGKAWYEKYKDNLEEAGEDLGILSRQNINALKVAFLLHVQGYRDPRDKEISKETLQAAIQLIQATYLVSYSAINEVKHKGEYEHVFKMKSYIMQRGNVGRQQLQAALRLPLARFNEVLLYLFEQGEISVWTEDMKEQKTRPTRKSTERYKYEGKVITCGDYTELGL